jgi:hypothetical protein
VPDASEKQKNLDTPTGFTRANSIADVPHGPGLVFVRTTFQTLVFFIGAAFDGVTRLYKVFTFSAVNFLDTSAFHFLVTACEASVPGSNRGA